MPDHVIVRRGVYRVIVVVGGAVAFRSTIGGLASTADALTRSGSVGRGCSAMVEMAATPTAATTPWSR